MISAAPTARVPLARRAASSRPRARRVGRLPVPTSTTAIEAAYFAEIVRIVVDPFIAAVREILIPALPAIVADTPDTINPHRRDAADVARNDGFRDAIRMLIERMGVRLDTTPAQALDGEIGAAGAATSMHNAKQLAKQFAAAGAGGGAGGGAGNPRGEWLRLHPFLGDPHLPELMDAWAKENAALITQMRQKAIDDVRGIVVRAVAGGRRHEDIAQEIQARILAKSSTNPDGTRSMRGVTARARLIARDQISKLNGDLTAQRQRALGVESFTWRTMRDPRVRPEHAELEGKVFSWSDLPSEGKPGDAINCLPGGARIGLSPPIVKAYRRRYSGDLTFLVTDSGKSLTCTPNHPVLTRCRGWAPAHLVDVGDDVFDAPVDRDFVSENKGQHGEPTIEQIFDTLAQIGVGARVAGGRGDFHGDGVVDEDVDVVGWPWGLGNNAESTRDEQRCKLALAAADVSLAHVPGADNAFDCLRALGFAPDSSVRGLSKLLSFLRGRASHPHGHGVGSRSTLDAVALQHIADCLPGDAVVLREKLHAVACDETTHALVARELARVSWRTSSARNCDAPSAQQLAEVIGAAPNDGGCFDKRGTFRNSTSRIVKKSVGKDASVMHVFNLETVSGWYGSGIVTQNCRCYAEPLLSGFGGNE